MASALLNLTNLPANSVRDMLLDADEGASNLRFITRPSRVTYALEANAVGGEFEIFAGSRQVQERSGFDGSGGAGTMPNMQQKGQSFLAAAGEILEARVRETAGVATTDITMFIDVTPIA